MTWEPATAPSRAGGHTVYVIYEGRRTEKDYFTLFAKTARNSDRFTLIELSKDGFDADRTDRPTMVELARGHMEMIRHRRFTPFLHVTTVLRNIETGSVGRVDPDLFDRIRRSVMTALDSRSGAGIVGPDGLVADADRMNDLISRELDRRHVHHGPDAFDLHGYTPRGRRYDPARDRVFVVFDRDLDPNCPELRTGEEYHRVLDMCEGLGFTPVVSTPMFELWLLLHHEDADVSGIGPTLLYKDAIEDMLEDMELCAGKRITRERFDRYYRDTFPRAVEASKREPLTTDLRSLENMAGTRVGVELADLAGIE